MDARKIDHEEAIRDLMAERYLLGELNATEREAYEEHLFSCDTCFEQVKTGTEFVSHLRRIGTDDPRPALASGFFGGFANSLRQPATIVACALLICVSTIGIYQQRMIAGLRRPQVTPSFFLSDGARAGGVKSIVLPPNTRFDLSIQVLQRGGFSAYQGQILDQSQRQKASFPISAEQTQDTIHLLMDSSLLRPGTYFVVVNGFTQDGRKTEITRYSFELQRKD
jgi:hypothetical protein